MCGKHSLGLILKEFLVDMHTQEWHFRLEANLIWTLNIDIFFQSIPFRYRKYFSTTMIGLKGELFSLSSVTHRHQKAYNLQLTTKALSLIIA
jgi:hypothetical protein